MGNSWTAAAERRFYYSDGSLVKSKLRPTVDSATPVNLTLRNDTPYELNVFWLDYDGNKVLYGPLPANGTTRLFTTFLTHPWAFEVLRRPDLVAVVNDKRVVFPKPGGSLEVITMARPVHWQVAQHRHFALVDPAFGLATQTLLLCHHASHNAGLATMEPTSTDSAGPSRRPRPVASSPGSCRQTAANQASPAASLGNGTLTRQLSTALPRYLKRMSSVRAIAPASKMSKRSSGQRADDEEEPVSSLLGKLPMDVLLAIIRCAAPTLHFCAPTPPSDLVDLPVPLEPLPPAGDEADADPL